MHLRHDLKLYKEEKAEFQGEINKSITKEKSFYIPHLVIYRSSR